MAFQVQGKLHKLFDVEQKTDSFQAREFILEIAESQYPQLIKFQLTQDKCVLVDDYSVGDEIVVHFDLRGREWKERYFTNLNAWKIEKPDGSKGGKNDIDAANDAAAAASEDSRAHADFDDDIPF